MHRASLYSQFTTLLMIRKRSIICKSVPPTQGRTDLWAGHLIRRPCTAHAQIGPIGYFGVTPPAASGWSTWRVRIYWRVFAHFCLCTAFGKSLCRDMCGRPVWQAATALGRRGRKAEKWVFNPTRPRAVCSFLELAISQLLASMASQQSGSQTSQFSPKHENNPLVCNTILSSYLDS